MNDAPISTLHTVIKKCLAIDNVLKLEIHLNLIINPKKVSEESIIHDFQNIIEDVMQFQITEFVQSPKILFPMVWMNLINKNLYKFPSLTQVRKLSES